MSARAVAHPRCRRTRSFVLLAVMASVLGVLGLAGPAIADPVTYTGHVTREADGSPVSGAIVRASSDSGEELARTKTDADGYYSMPGVENSGGVHVCAVQDAPEDQRTLAEACDYGFGFPENDLVMPRVTPVSGTLRPLPGWQLPGSLLVVLEQYVNVDYENPWGTAGEASVDPDTGRFVIGNVPDGDYRLCAVHVVDDFAGSRELLGCAGGTQIEDGDDVLVRGVPIRRDFTVADRGRLTVDLTATPASEASALAQGSVAVFNVARDGRGGDRRLFVEAADVGGDGLRSYDLAPGRYRVKFQPAEDSPLLTTWNGGAEGFDAAPDIVVTSSHTTAARVDVPAKAGISGHVSGTPEDRRAVIRVVKVATQVPVGATETDSDGGWRIDDLRPGSYRVDVERDESSDQAAQFYDGVAEGAGAAAATPVVLGPGEHRSGVDSTVQAGGSATVRLIEGNGAAAAGVTVRAYTDDDHLTGRVGVATGGGVFVIRGLQRGAYEFVVTKVGERTYARYFLDGSGRLTTAASAAAARTVGDSTLQLGVLRVPSGEPGAAPTTTSPPTISGSPGLGSTLTAHPGVWSVPGLTFTYQWRTPDGPITGATSATYVPTSQVVGQVLRVDVAASKAGLRVGYDSASTAVEIGQSPRIVSVSAPALSRVEPVVGQPLSVSGGSWSTTPTSTTFQWYRDGSSIKGATSASYVPITADQGERLSVIEIVRRPGYAAGSVEVEAVAPTAAAGAAPSVINIVRPKVTGQMHVGEVLSATTGTWSTTGLTYRYQWLAWGTPIDGAIRSTYTIPDDQLYKNLTVRVTAAKAGYRSGSAESVGDRSVTEALKNTIPPTVVGWPAVDQTLYANIGSWTVAALHYDFQWFSGSTAIEGATQQSYRVPYTQRGAVISVRVTASRDDYAAVSVTSARTVPVEPGQFSINRPPTIAGSGAVGTTLSYVPTTVSPSPTSLRLQWLRDGVPTGVFSRSYVISDADRGSTLSLRVTYGRLGFTTVEKTTAGVTVPST